MKVARRVWTKQNSTYICRIVRDSKKTYDYTKQIEVTSKEEYYYALKGALEKFEESVEIKVKNYNHQDFKLDVLNKIVLEHPEIDYGYEQSNVQVSGYSGSNERTLKITLKYRLPKKTMIKQKTAVENKTKEFLNSHITNSMKDVEREIAIHDYLVKNAEYDVENYKKGITVPENHNAYGVLVLGKGVCESYAKAFYTVAKVAGLEVKYVTGIGNNAPGRSENHAWNMVKLDGEWYNVDVTWDDPIYNSPKDKWIEVQYKYFNLPDSIMNKTHTRDEKLVKYPIANGTKYAYEKLNIKEEDKDGNVFHAVKSKDELDNKIKEAIEGKETTLTLKVYDIGMDQSTLLGEIQKVIHANIGMNTNGLKNYGIKTSGDSIKYVQYTFNY
ncbi:transglutaminase [Clostridium tetani]|nr:transglutaminase [Clostridium tetani]